jgi:tRNA pseudouridine13 synthase
MGLPFVLTELQADHAELDARLERIKRDGVPNYFGLQRFGYEGGNVHGAREYADRQELPVQRNLRSRLLSAGRSYLFNRVLAERVAAGSWNQARVGDLLAFTDSRSFFPAARPNAAIHGWPCWICIRPVRCGAPASRLPAGDVQALEMQAAATEPSIAKWLAEAGMKHERRILRLPMGGLSWHYPEPDILQLEFVLPTGCFATAVVRELVSLAGQTDI